MNRVELCVVGGFFCTMLSLRRGRHPSEQNGHHMPYILHENEIILCLKYFKCQIKAVNTGSGKHFCVVDVPLLCTLLFLHSFFSHSLFKCVRLKVLLLLFFFNH